MMGGHRSVVIVPTMLCFTFCRNTFCLKASYTYSDIDTFDTAVLEY